MALVWFSIYTRLRCFLPFPFPFPFSPFPFPLFTNWDRDSIYYECHWPFFNSQSCAIESPPPLSLLLSLCAPLFPLSPGPVPPCPSLLPLLPLLPFNSPFKSPLCPLLAPPSPLWCLHSTPGSQLPTVHALSYYRHAWQVVCSLTQDARGVKRGAHHFQTGTRTGPKPYMHS